ncbi:ADP-ribosylation factor-binding protein GGA1 isoform X2 [Camelus dromedarius]|uniref:ADP-ribosylation factor-binding protein GGA1 isoform X1 n=4 Tax=Camelus TaxID=9836 RepID=A0A8B8U0H9_CAMFR|nr:ADP-ribosylation factor-binding protein GGA1 isoform X1 [Camelus bactrianus]XP_031319090.1 ADP-ribosylation factor-binding protein GGA1 isoform X1 [Camelus dromedarius]XP_032348079.1 ADP-ribosylation factor-binding protein GGA1 isoform X1 [Camelus ferus]
MEPAMEPETLEARINRATNPLNKELNWASINSFCEQLNEDFEGPPLATRLLAHKIQSPQEWEAIQALTVLETCMKSCGKRFHDEVGKFRFLNELIKVVSPKYLGSRTSEKVKNKILELLYSWTVGLPEEVKIAEAYQMLKKQGIVKADPKLPDDATFPLPPPRPKNVIFEDEEKSKMLARLLKSSHPEDLRAANKLIKEMVQEDQKRMEKISKRVSAIEEVNNNVKLLTEMVMNHSQGRAVARSSEDLMKELYQRCERMRPTLFRLASDTEDNDEALAEILQANDNLTQVITLYKQLVRGEEVNGDATAASIPGSTSALLDLSGLDLPPASTTCPAMPTCPGDQASPEQPSTSVSLLDDELMSLGLSDPTPPAGPSLDGVGWNSFQSSEGTEPPAPAPAPSVDSQPPAQTSLPASSGLDDLDLLGKTLLQQSLPPESQQVRWEKQQPAPRLTLRDLQNKSSCSVPSSGASSRLHTVSPEPPGPLQQPTPTELSLANITVPLESIKPSSILPVTVYDQHGFRVLFHFARDPLPGRSDVLVVVVSMLSTAPQPIRNIVFQSAVPKVMKVKLQPPSGTELPAFNPIVHPSAITQVLLLANPQKEKVRLRYKLLFTMGDQTYNEMGDVDQFPPPETWGSL